MLLPRTCSGCPAFLFFTGEPASVVVSACCGSRITVVHGRHCFSGEGRIRRCGALDADPGLGFDGENCNTVRVDIMDDFLSKMSEKLK
jgi:hypothetical protein